MTAGTRRVRGRQAHHVMRTLSVAVRFTSFPVAKYLLTTTTIDCFKIVLRYELTFGVSFHILIKMKSVKTA